MKKLSSPNTREKTRMKIKYLTSRDKTKRERGERGVGDIKGRKKEKLKH